MAKMMDAVVTNTGMEGSKPAPHKIWIKYGLSKMTPMAMGSVRKNMNSKAFGLSRRNSSILFSATRLDNRGSMTTPNAEETIMIIRTTFMAAP